MRGVSMVLAGAVCVAGGCAAGGAGPADPPPAIHPTELFPAPPGFAASAAGPSRWRFTGRGSAGAAAIFYRTSCVQLFEWSPVDEQRDDDGSWTLRYRRPDARLSVHVGESNDRLEILVTLERGPASSSRPDTNPERNRGEATDPAGRSGGRTDR
jgi:hypothetical protein